MYTGVSCRLLLRVEEIQCYGREQVKIYLAVKMRLALVKKDFECLVVLESGTDNLAEDLSVKLSNFLCLIKAWFGCF